MLNTDLHNPNIKPERKMTLSQFVGTNKDYGQEVSQGKELPLNYLVSIYNSIKSSEFETHKKTPGIVEDDSAAAKGGDNMFDIDLTELDPSKIINDDNWQDMLRRSQHSDQNYYGGGHEARDEEQHDEEQHDEEQRDEEQRDDNEHPREGHKMAPGGCSSKQVFQCSRDVFVNVHACVSNALRVVLETVNDGSVMEEMMDGFLLLARGGALYECLDVLDGVMSALATFTGLPSGRTSMTAAQRTSSLLQYGSNHKGHMATMALFGVYRRFNGVMGSTGWETIVAMLSSMWQINMLPRALLTPPPMLLSQSSSGSVVAESSDGLSGGLSGGAASKCLPVRTTTRAHEHYMTVSRVTRAQAKSERGLRQTTSSGLFSWLFVSGGNEDDKRLPTS